MSSRKSSKKSPLESIDKRLKTIERKIDKIPKKKDSEKSFIINILLSLALVLISISIPLIVQMFGYEKYDLLWIVIPYIIITFALLFLIRKILVSRK